MGKEGTCAFLVFTFFTVYNHIKHSNKQQSSTWFLYYNTLFFFQGKPRGLRTARKLKNHRRDQRWHDKGYKKAHLGTALKANPFGGASHAKGIVLEKV